MWILDGSNLKLFCHVVHQLIVPQHIKFEYLQTPIFTDWLHFIPVEYCHSLIIVWLCQGKIPIAGSLKLSWGWAGQLQNIQLDHFYYFPPNLNVIADQVPRNRLVMFAKWVVESGHFSSPSQQTSTASAYLLQWMFPSLVFRVSLRPCPATEDPWCSSCGCLYRNSQWKYSSKRWRRFPLIWALMYSAPHRNQAKSTMRGEKGGPPEAMHFGFSKQLH